MRKTIKAWGGFCDGELHFFSDSIRIAATYRTRKEAEKDYEDVRPVTITYSLPKRTKK